MAIVYSCGNFHVEAVSVAGRNHATFRVCEYHVTESTVIDTFADCGFRSGLRAAIALCEERASRALDVPDELS